MDNFIYSVPNYIFDWSKYIDNYNHSKHDHLHHPQKDLFNFLNIPDTFLSKSENDDVDTSHNNKSIKNKTRHKQSRSSSSKLSKTIRSKSLY